MIEENIRDNAVKKYVNQSPKLQHAVALFQNIKAETIKLLLNHFSDSKEEFSKISVDYIIPQANISFRITDYYGNCPYCVRDVIDNTTRIDLHSAGFIPRLLTSVGSGVDQKLAIERGFEAEEKTLDKEWLENINKSISMALKEVDEVRQEAKALDDALHSASMNKTSIKKFYPKLYDLIYDKAA